MSQITFIAHDGAQTSVAIEAGKSLMQLAVENGVSGIDGDCGGECACGTCHVIVSAEWSDVAGTAQANEQQMLDMTPERAATSRLACCIQVTDAMAGMTVHLPEFQM